MSQFLCNGDGLELGQTQAGVRVGDVELPPWASSAADFTAKCREALECDHVSENLHHWIDLIFGFKQRGPEAIKADNLFYYLTYEGAVDLEAIADRVEREGMESQIMEFGQTPKQLFTIPHPQRITASAMARQAELGDFVSEVTMGALSAGLEDVVLVDDLQPGIAGEAIMAIEPAATSSVATAGWGGIVNLVLNSQLKIHREGVNFVTMDTASKTLYSVSQDGTLKLHSLEDQTQMHSVVIGDLALSSIALLPDETVSCCNDSEPTTQLQ